MKLVVETTGTFQLVYPEQQELARATGYSVVEKSQFWAGHLMTGRLIVKGQVNDEASDAEWLETVRGSDGDLDLALASFLDRFPVDAESARKPEPPPSIPSTVQTGHNKGRKTAG